MKKVILTFLSASLTLAYASENIAGGNENSAAPSLTATVLDGFVPEVPTNVVEALREELQRPTVPLSWIQQLDADLAPNPRQLTDEEQERLLNVCFNSKDLPALHAVLSADLVGVDFEHITQQDA